MEISVGDKVAASDIIGNVGMSGTATGPNLHYEVHVNGRPTDPMLDERLAAVAKTNTLEALLLSNLKDARAQLSARLSERAAYAVGDRI